MSKIIKLTASNVKRLSAVSITPEGALVVIGGKNGQGKSSTLDAIQYALGGDTSDPMPVRRGEEKAVVVVDLGEIIVKRTFTAAGGTSLVVTDADGVRKSGPQGILDKLTGKLTFDPLEFSRQKPKQQAETLRSLLGIDFTDADAKREKLFNERTLVNRDAKTLEARMQGMPTTPGLPAEEISTAEILEEQRKASAQNAANAIQRQNLEMRQSNLGDCEKDVNTASNLINRLESELKVAREDYEKAVEEEKKTIRLVKAQQEVVAGLADVSLEGFKAKLAEAEVTNSRIRANRARADVVKQYKAKSEEAENLTAAIGALDDDKRRQVTSAKFPIPGLSFDAAGNITLNEIPFQQACSSLQLQTSVAIGIALNPKLRIMLCRDGSLLDADSLKMLGEMAEKHDVQIWLEMVDPRLEGAIIIEDGRISNPEPETP
ncbi:MAG: AAA family ATPase [Solirubrobacterales bacterium]